MHHPGIEPGSHRWQRRILPLNHWCYCFSLIYDTLIFPRNWCVVVPFIVGILLGQMRLNLLIWSVTKDSSLRRRFSPQFSRRWRTSEENYAAVTSRWNQEQINIPNMLPDAFNAYYWKLSPPVVTSKTIIWPIACQVLSSCLRQFLLVTNTAWENMANTLKDVCIPKDVLKHVSGFKPMPSIV